MTRTERRAIMRAQGYRGRKSRRNRVPKEVAEALVPIVAEHQAAVADAEHRSTARQMGLVIPPSALEAEALRSKGVPVGTGGLLLPS